MRICAHICTYLRIDAHVNVNIYEKKQRHMFKDVQGSVERERDKERERETKRERESSDQQIVKRFSYPQNKINHTSPYG